MKGQINPSDLSNQCSDVTVILNIWKRNHLEEQLRSVLLQSVLPIEIWIIHYENHVEIKDLVNDFLKIFPAITLIESSKNLKYFGRFSVAINVSSKYVLLIDDDVIPGEKWIENSVQKCESLNSIIACTGRIIPPNNFRPEEIGNLDRKKYFIGDMTYLFKNYCPQDTQVDYGCNSYFLKTEWLQAFWSVWPRTFLSAEDIHLSATCKYKLGINTYVIAQHSPSDCGNRRKGYGVDEVASWKQNKFIELREQALKYHIETNNWKPLTWL